MSAEVTYHWAPFVAPMPVWDYWYWLLLPLCAGVSIVYKSVKCASMKDVPRQAAVIFFMILAGLGLAALALVWLLDVTVWLKK